MIESRGKLPEKDLKLIAPNACPKLVIPFKNGIVGKTAEWDHVSRENKITFIGISDIPSMVDFEKDSPAGNITIEFSPLGTYRFFNMQLGDFKNKICDYSDISQKAVLELEEKLVNTPIISEKLEIAQRYLLTLFMASSSDQIFDYCIQQILNTKGRVNISHLEKYTGYSARWLNMKFQSKIGISPKNLASIIRFQQYYHTLVNDTELFFLQKEFYNYYYDQSHFIKDFKRFTGYSPVHFGKSSNDYDKAFYKG